MSWGADRSLARTSVLAALVVLTPAPPWFRPSPPRASDTGTLIVRWSVGGQTTADACGQIRAATVEVDAYDQAGSKVAGLSPPCTAFMAAAVLPEGRYEVLAVPEDDRGRLASLPLIRKVVIEQGAERTLSFEFPSTALAIRLGAE